MKTKTVRIYSCEKHPNWTLETSAPEIGPTLTVVCPLCRDAFMIASIGRAECRTEEREVEPSPAPVEEPDAQAALF